MIDKQYLTVPRGTHKKNYTYNGETHQKNFFIMEILKEDICRVKLVREKINCSRDSIKSSTDAAGFIRTLITDGIDIFETGILLLLNQRNSILGYAVLSVGGINGTVFDIRLVLKYAIDCLATGVILAHNHPSGNINASQADINTTKKIKEALKLVDIQLLDHVVLSGIDDLFTSLADEGLL